MPGIRQFFSHEAQRPELGVPPPTVYSLLSGNPTGYTVSGPNDFTLGFTWTPNVNVTIVGINLFHDLLMPSNPRKVRLWNPSIVLHETVTVPASTLTEVVSASLVTPLSVSSGQTVTLGLDVNEKWTQAVQQLSQTTGSVLGVAAYGGGSGGSYPSSANDQYWGLDVQFTIP
jgi:hypothetical protein